MLSVEYFLKEYNYNILTSVSNLKASEFVCVGEGEYKKFSLTSNPYILRQGEGISLAYPGCQRKKIEFFYPITSPASQYQLMPINILWGINLPFERLSP